MLKKYYHVTAIGNKESIIKNGWIISSHSPHGAFYGRAIYFWENILDAIDIGEYWYGSNNYEIVTQNIYLKNYKKIDKDYKLLSTPDQISLYFLDKNIKILIIDEAYLSHRRKIIAKGGLLSWLVNLNGKDQIVIKSKELEKEL